MPNCYRFGASADGAILTLFCGRGAPIINGMTPDDRIARVRERAAVEPIAVRLPDDPRRLESFEQRARRIAREHTELLCQLAK